MLLRTPQIALWELIATTGFIAGFGGRFAAGREEVGKRRDQRIERKRRGGEEPIHPNNNLLDKVHGTIIKTVILSTKFIRWTST